MTTKREWVLWPNHWAGGWGEHSILPNRIRIQQQDDSEILFYVEHHGTGDGQDKYPTERDYERARFLILAANNHAELVRVLEDLARAASRAIPHHPLGLYMQRLIDAADTVIAKATPKKEN